VRPMARSVVGGAEERGEVGEEGEEQGTCRKMPLLSSTSSVRLQCRAAPFTDDNNPGASEQAATTRGATQTSRAGRGGQLDVERTEPRGHHVGEGGARLGAYERAPERPYEGQQECVVDGALHALEDLDGGSKESTGNDEGRGRVLGNLVPASPRV